MAHIGFNPTTVEAAIPTGLLPKGRYIVVCDKSEVKPNKKGTGHILSLQFVVESGEFKKKRIFDHINIQNENPVAQRIGQQHLAAFCHALGIQMLENSFQLHGIPVEVDIAIQEGKDGWEAKNVIKGFVKKAPVPETGLNLSGTGVSAMPTPSVAPIASPPIAPAPASVGLSNMDDDIPF